MVWVVGVIPSMAGVIPSMVGVVPSMAGVVLSMVRVVLSMVGLSGRPSSPWEGAGTLRLKPRTNSYPR